MKLKINQDKAISEAEIIINCPTIDLRVRNLIDYIRQCSASLPGTVDDMTFRAPLDTILYIESIDRKTFFYDTQRVFRCNASLSALEARLEHYLFTRISKNCIVNITQISSTYRCDNHKLGLLLNNGERLIAGRTYAEEVQNKVKRFRMTLSDIDNAEKAVCF